MHITRICDIHKTAWMALAIDHIAELTGDADAEPELALTCHSFDLPHDHPRKTYCWVALADGEVCGFLIAMVHQFPFWPGPMVYVSDVYVAPKHRRKGMGRALMDAAICFGKAMEAHHIWWMTKADNPARALYDQIARSTDVAMYCGLLPAGARVMLKK